MSGARRFLDGWHRLECVVAVVCFSFIAGILLLDVIGRVRSSHVGTGRREVGIVDLACRQEPILVPSP